MKKFHIRIVNGWCGNRMIIIRDHLAGILEDEGYEFKLDNQSIWENSSPPTHVDLVFQLIPAFSEAELGCPSISIRPFLKDLNDPKTLDGVLNIVDQFCPKIERMPAR
jgi:hypothetical protein